MDSEGSQLLHALVSTRKCITAGNTDGSPLALETHPVLVSIIIPPISRECISRPQLESRCLVIETYRGSLFRFLTNFHVRSPLVIFTELSFVMLHAPESTRSGLDTIIVFRMIFPYTPFVTHLTVLPHSILLSFIAANIYLEVHVGSKRNQKFLK